MTKILLTSNNAVTAAKIKNAEVDAAENGSNAERSNETGTLHFSHVPAFSVV